MDRDDPRLRRALALQRGALAAGAAYDGSFAAVYCLAPAWGAATFGVPLPGERFYLWLIAIFLAMLAALYAVASRDPQRHLGIVRVAAAGRLAGAVALGVAATEPGLGGLATLALADGAFGLLHAHGALRLRGR